VEIGHIPLGCGNFFIPLRYTSVRVPQGTPSSTSLAGQKNCPQRGLEIFLRWVLAGLAWNDAIYSFIKYFFSLEQNSLLAKFIYAAIITLFATIIISSLERMLEERAEKKE
jgi:hypothetical protein